MELCRNSFCSFVNNILKLLLLLYIFCIFFNIFFYLYFIIYASKIYNNNYNCVHIQLAMKRQVHQINNWWYFLFVNYFSNKTINCCERASNLRNFIRFYIFINLTKFRTHMYLKLINKMFQTHTQYTYLYF